MNKTNILLAEDDKDDYLFLVEAFKKVSSDYKISRVNNGLDCIISLKNEHTPDLIFLDLNIPIKSGLECLHFIKDNEHLASVPVVMYSTSHYIKSIDAAFKQGASYYIVKPTSLESLVEILIVVTSRLEAGLIATSKENFVVRSIAGIEQ